jgi:hypothetical protein
MFPFISISMDCSASTVSFVWLTVHSFEWTLLHYCYSVCWCQHNNDGSGNFWANYSIGSSIPRYIVSSGHNEIQTDGGDSNSSDHSNPLNHRSRLTTFQAFRSNIQQQVDRKQTKLYADDVQLTDIHKINFLRVLRVSLLQRHQNLELSKCSFLIFLI